MAVINVSKIMKENTEFNVSKAAVDEMHSYLIALLENKMNSINDRIKSNRKFKTVMEEHVMHENARAGD